MPITATCLVGKKLTDMQGRADQAKQVAQQFADFVAGATKTLDIAIYHFRLAGAEGKIVLDALTKSAESCQVRLAYFLEKPGRDQSQSIAEHGGDIGGLFNTSLFDDSKVQLKGIEGIDLNHLPVGTNAEPIEGGGHLMHSKYIIRDGKDVWMGSANFTSEAWSVQDNNIVIFTDADDLARYYGTDFQELWDNGRIAGTGKNDQGSVDVGGTQVDVDFSPGDGATIDGQIAGLISTATHSVHVASMVISSGKVLGALVDAIEKGITVTGVYDGPQMEGVEGDWQRAADAHHGGASNGKPEQWVIVKNVLAGKKSLKFNPHKQEAAYNFMHNKLVVIDREQVLTGSFNFSQNATHNAENVVLIEDAGIAGKYADYVEKLNAMYG